MRFILWNVCGLLEAQEMLRLGTAWLLSLCLRCPDVGKEIWGE